MSIHDSNEKGVQVKDAEMEWQVNGYLIEESLTYWDWDKIAAISQTTFWNAFSSLKIY